MSYDGNGNYTVPAGTTAVTGTVIDSADYNALLADLQTALTKAFLRDGQSAALANLPMGGYKLTGLAAGSNANDSVRFDQLTAGSIVNTPAGGIAATTVQAALNELDTEKIAAGAVTGSGLTMSTARMLGRSTAGTGAIEEFTAAQVAAFDGSVTLTGAQTVAGVKTFSDKPIFSAGPGAGNTNQSCVRVYTANGYGSSSTKIRRFTTVSINQGTDITYADSATLGGSFTVNANGIYSISYADDFSAGEHMGISLNTSAPSTGIQTITGAEKLVACTPSAGSYSGAISITLYLAAGSVIRAHTNTAPATGGSLSTQFTMALVS